MRRQVIRRLTMLQTMLNVLKYRKILKNGSLRLRCGCIYFFNLLKTSTVIVLKLDTYEVMIPMNNHTIGFGLDIRKLALFEYSQF